MIEKDHLGDWSPEKDEYEEYEYTKNTPRIMPRIRILLFVSLQSHVLGFIKDLFNFDIADYSSVESLCDSIVRLARERMGLLLRKHDHDPVEITDPFSQVKSLNVQNESVEVGKSEAT